MGTRITAEESNALVRANLEDLRQRTPIDTGALKNSLLMRGDLVTTVLLKVPSVLEVNVVRVQMSRKQWYELAADVQRLVKNSLKINAIQRLVRALDCRIIDAKKAVDELQQMPQIPESWYK